MFWMTWLIAKSQIKISKNPISGATAFSPLEMKLMRRVPRVTSMTRARKMRAAPAQMDQSPN